MSQKNLENLISKLESIKDKQYLRSHRRDSTGIGYTLETLLGIKENRISDSDWGEIELKTMREHSNSDISLFVIDPHYYYISNDSDFIEKYGYPNINDPKFLALSKLLNLIIEIREGGS